MPDEAIARLRRRGAAADVARGSRAARRGRAARPSSPSSTARSSASRASARHATSDDRSTRRALRDLPPPVTAGTAGIGRALLERAEESMRASGFDAGDPLGAGGQRARRALLPRRRLGARRPEGRHLPGRRGRGAPLPQGSVTPQPAGREATRPPARTSTPTTIPPQFRRRERVVLDVGEREERRRVDLGAERSSARRRRRARASSPTRSPTGTSTPQAAPPRAVSTSTRFSMSPL